MSKFLSFHYFYCRPADIESRKKKSDFGRDLGIVLLTSHSPQEKKRHHYTLLKDNKQKVICFQLAIILSFRTRTRLVTFKWHITCYYIHVCGNMC